MVFEIFLECFILNLQRKIVLKILFLYCKQLEKLYFFCFHFFKVMPKKRIPEVSVHFIFTMIDAENTGSIVITRAKEVFNQINESHGYDSITVNKFFETMVKNDTNKDGLIDYKQFKDAFSVIKNAK